MWNVLGALLRKMGIAVTIPISWTGYSHSMKDLVGLFEAICVTYDSPDFRPREGLTFCNMAAGNVAGLMGCADLYGKIANDIVDFMSASVDWSKVDNWTKAQDLANSGSLLFAVQKGNPHGHICTIRPGKMKSAGKWNCQVPSVMNIGATCFIDRGLNWAFAEPPVIYVWRKSL